MPADQFAVLLRGASVSEVVDVRSYPWSRHNPQFGSGEMARWLPESGIAYSWLEDLGGRRRGVPASQHTALRHPSFRAYADHMETEIFTTGVEELMSRGGVVAVMCSEAVWWRCHRRLLADHLVMVRGVDVEHLMHDGRLTPHSPTEGVRRAGDRLVYDLGDDSGAGV